MIIGGFQKFSLADFPGKISAIVFTRGCNFHCPYCHNPELVDPERYASPLDEGNIFEFLKRRCAQLEAVVITGGEPTIHPDLPNLIREVKSLGLSIKLDTNGSNPEMIEAIVKEGLVDYFAMDIKAPLDAYERITRVPTCVADIERSIALIVNSGVPHEMRTTWLQTLLSFEEMCAVADSAKGCRQFVLQAFQPSKALDTRVLKEVPPSPESMGRLQALITSRGIPCVTR